MKAYIKEMVDINSSESGRVLSIRFKIDNTTLVETDI